jgi:hypothetical protein
MIAPTHLAGQWFIRLASLPDALLGTISKQHTVQIYVHCPTSISNNMIYTYAVNVTPS